jgi:hypothetical protein
MKKKKPFNLKAECVFVVGFALFYFVLFLSLFFFLFFGQKRFSMLAYCVRQRKKFEKEPAQGGKKNQEIGKEQTAKSH